MSEPNESDEMTVCVRPYDPPEDTAFLFASWRNALWFGDPENDGYEKDSSDFYSEQTRRIRRLLKHPDTRVRIACLKSDPTIIIGYSVRRANTLEFIYVKQDYRGKKIGTLLAQGTTHVSRPTTLLGTVIVEKKKIPIQENERHGRNQAKARKVDKESPEDRGTDAGGDPEQSATTKPAAYH